MKSLEGLKTIIGAVISMVTPVAILFDVAVSPEFVSEATEITVAVIGLAGSAYAIYGRLVAKYPGWFASNR
jgi:threonine/homoserine/homoserine lactone efflux protein